MKKQGSDILGTGRKGGLVYYFQKNNLYKLIDPDKKAGKEGLESHMLAERRFLHKANP